LAFRQQVFSVGWCVILPCDADRGTIVITLNVDEDDDEVHFSNVAFRGEAGELLSEAIEVLVACRNALRASQEVVVASD
jgi:hypothetical protein